MMRTSEICYSMLEISVYAIFMVILLLDYDTKQCGIPLIMWLTVYFGSLALNMLLKLTNIIFNKKIKWLKYLSNGYTIIMFVFMFCWLIYGNVLYFADENDCGDWETTHGWNIFMLIILIVGYL